MTTHVTYGDHLREGDELAVRDLARVWSRSQGHTTDTANSFAQHYVDTYFKVGERWVDLPSFPDAWRWAVNGWESFALSADGGLHDEYGRCLTSQCPDDAH